MNNKENICVYSAQVSNLVFYTQSTSVLYHMPHQ